MNFLKNNTHFIWRLILNQIGLTIFGLMTSLSASALDASLHREGKLFGSVSFWASVFAILFYMFIDYTAIKEEGQRDKIRIEAGRIERDPWRGFKIAMIAAIPNLLLAASVLIFGALGAEGGPALEWAGAACGSAKLIALVAQAMYWGVITRLPGVGTVAGAPALAYVLIPLPAIICVSLAYVAGLHEVSLIRRIKKWFTPEAR